MAAIRLEVIFVTELTPRQSDILNIARSSGRVTVEDLARRFEVSAQTIRKDLNDLCDRRSMTRVHGGAIIASGVENLAYEARRFVAAEEKQAIGLAAADPREPLWEALRAAFKYASLERMLRMKLNVRLDEISAPGNFQDVVAEVIQWAETTGRVADLLHAALAANPDSPQLKRVLDQYGEML